MNATDPPLVMLIDDNEIDIFVNKKFLRAAGITGNTLPFSRAKDALDYLLENKDIPQKLPKIILLDIQMPEINGFQFLDLFEKFPQYLKEEIKIVLLSSTLDPIDIDRAHKNKYVTAILKKPLEVEGLKTALGI